MYAYVKRGLDFAAAGLGLIILSPLLVLIAIGIWGQMGAPVFFRHQRPGYKGQPFAMIKFRTMRSPKPGENMYLTDAERITPFGNFLRNYSLDELPELINVLTGDMSLVGPRPLLMEMLKVYTPEQARRHDVRPGITGWAQVNGRQNLTYSKRLEYDVWYVDHMSLGLDIKILLLTLQQVLQGEGVVTGQAIDDVDDMGVFPVAGEDQNLGD